MIGPSGTFAALSDGAKWILSAGMLLGRLELFGLWYCCCPPSGGIKRRNLLHERRQMLSDLRFERSIEILHHPFCQLKPKLSRCRMEASSAIVRLVFAQRRLRREDLYRRSLRSLLRSSQHTAPTVPL